jgi:integrase
VRSDNYSAEPLGLWRLHRCNVHRDWSSIDAQLELTDALDVGALLARNGTVDGQEFLINTDGRVVVEVNEFFASRRMRNRRRGTREKYARGLCVWLGYLDAVGRCWHEVLPKDVDAFKFWRMTDEANPMRVAGSSVADNIQAISAFYEWAQERHDVRNPVDRREVAPHRHGQVRAEPFAATPHVVRDRDVKWLDPGGYDCWRDIGLRGLDRDGREIRGWRGRNSQRDCAFADGLYGTGLRVSEWATVLMVELRAEDASHGYYTCRLASECGKGGRGRQYWMPRWVLADVLSYIESGRAAAVRRARLEGRYDRVPDRLVLVGQGRNRRVRLRAGGGAVSEVSLDALDGIARARIFRETSTGLEPVSLWLNEDGLPRLVTAWEHTFTEANQRLTRAGLVAVSATPHMLRHSFALRWFSVGKLVYERRFAHLDGEELRDFRAQFGDTWYLVKTLLGHADVSVTMSVYLEPFRDLDVSVLIAHAQSASMSALVAEMFAEHPQVISRPTGAGA